MSDNLSKTDMMENVIRLINGVGFPIVVSMALFWFNIQSLNNQSQLIAEFDTTMKGNRILLERIANDADSRSAITQQLINDINEIKRGRKNDL